MAKLTKELTWIYHYYFQGLSCPTPLYKSWQQFSSKKSIHFGNIQNKSRYFAYAITRAIPLVNFIQVWKVIIEVAWGSKGQNLPWLKILGMVLWLLALFLLVFCDTVILSLDFTRTFWRSVDTCDRIWEKARANLTEPVLTSLQSRKNFKVWRLFLHGFMFDFLAILNYSWVYAVNGEEDPTLLYSTIPWGNSSTLIRSVVYWLISMTSFITLSMGWSFYITFPGILALHLEYSMRTLATLVQHGPFGNYQLDSIMKDYKQLQFCIKEVNRSRMGRLLLPFYIFLGIQQTCQCYFGFQLIKSGAGWDDYQVYVIDVFLSTLRVFHEWYAISAMDPATNTFSQQVVIHWKKCQEGRKYRKVTSATIRSLMPALIVVEPYICRRNFALSGLSVYFDYIVCAALWP
ncbi:unnamed protein product [Orchesella dallaii]|uniref:Odorant receptor n=1 Tax=Orchesella dallaii TaxID=48710 RepID=A0ABP1RWR8_9HEXA